MSSNKIYNSGDIVAIEGEYICVPCGYKKNLKIGEKFGACTECLAGTDAGKKEFVEGTGIWERANK